MINMNDVVGDQLRTPLFQRQQANQTAIPARKQPETPSQIAEGDVYSKQENKMVGGRRFEYGYYNQNGKYVSVAGEKILQSLEGTESTTEDSPDLGDAFKQAYEIIKKLKEEKQSLNEIIKKAAQGVGLSESEVKNLKIEVDSSGKIVVGGISDVKKAKELQSRLNEQSGLANRFKNYQDNEHTLHTIFEKNKIGGINLASGAKGLDNIKEIAKSGQTPEDLGSLMDDPLAVAALDLYAISGPDFSYGSKGVADPSSALNKELDKAKKKIEEMFNNANMRAEQLASQVGNRNEFPASEKMSLSGATIKISADGSINIEGRFAQSNSANSEAETLVRMALNDMMQNGEDGSESVFATASRQLLVNHDDKYGEEAGTTVVMEIGSQTTKAYIVNPAKTLKMDSDIKSTAAKYLSQEAGISIAADMISVDDNGKISFNGSTANVDSCQAEKLIDQLNTQVRQARQNPAGQPEEIVRIAALLDEKDSYGPGGNASKGKASSTPAAAASDDAKAKTSSTPASTPSNDAIASPQAANTSKSKDSPRKSAAAPHVDSESQKQQQEAYDALYYKPEQDKAFRKWLDGEGEFQTYFLNKATNDGYSISVKDSEALSNFLNYTTTDANGNEIQANRFYRTKTGAFIPSFLEDAMNGEFVKDAEALKSLKASDITFSDRTGLEQVGFTKEERDDFLAIVNKIIKETDYDVKATAFSFEYSPDTIAAKRPNGEVICEDTGTASIRTYAFDIDSGRSGSKYYNAEEAEILTTYISNRLMDTDELWEKGYAQKLAMAKISELNHGGATAADATMRNYYRWS